MHRLIYALPLGFIALFYVYPLVAILGRAAGQAGASPALISLAQDGFFWRTLWFSAWQAALSTALTLLIGLPLSYVFGRLNFRGKTLLRALATVPFVMPVIVVAAAFSAVLGPRGLLNTLLMSLLHLDAPPIQMQNTLALMLIAHVFYNLSLVLRITGNFWANLDTRLTGAAQVLGASPMRAFRHITLPLLAPALGSSALLIFIFCFGAFGTVLVLAGPRYATLETEIYTQATSFLNLPMAAALSLVQMVVTLTLSLAYVRAQARYSRALPLASQTAQTLPPIRVRRFFVVAAGAFVLIFLAGPPLALVARSLFGPDAFSARAYAALWDADRNNAFSVAPINAIGNSLLVALGTGVLALLTGLPAAQLIHAGVGRLSRLMEACLMLPLGTSPVTLGLGYIVAFGQAPFNWRASPWIMPCAHALVALPFVVRALLPTLRAIDPALREAACMLGASPRRVWLEVDRPILMRGILVALTLAFTSSIGEFGASLLISRPDFPTIPMVIYQFLGQPGSANYGAALAMSSLLLLVAATGFVLIERVRIERVRIERVRIGGAEF